MRPSLVLSLFICLCVTVYAENSAYDYHRSVGIKRANEIRISESRVLGKDGRESRIVGGTPVTEQSHITHQAGIVIILTTGWTSVCGGSLISNTRVLTAAHCWYDGVSQARQFSIVLGSPALFTGGTRLVTTRVVVHPSWNTVNLTHDIAMVVIPAVQLSNSIQPVPLPTMDDMNRDFVGLIATVSGYGKTSDAQNSLPITTSLHQTSVIILSNVACQQSYDFDIHVGHLCTSGANNVGTCDGDSGGPLTVVQNNARILVGVVSFGLGNGCESGQPSVYTRVTAFLNWIQANM